MECRVTTNAPPSDSTPAWMGKGMKALKQARHEAEPSRVVAETTAECHECLDDLAIRPKGVATRWPIMLQDLQHHHIREFRAAPEPTLPRAWDHRDVNAYYASLYATLTPVGLVTKMRQLFAAIRHPAIPQRMTDVMYKTLVSGHNIGKKMSKEWEVKCRQCHRERRRRINSVEHAYAECARIHSTAVEGNH